MSDNGRNPIFTIGHSDHRIERFLVLLARNHIDAIADVRSFPRSRFSQFNQEEIGESLRAAGMHYVYMGDELGARRTELECYADGKARYELIPRLPLFRQGLARLQRGAAKFRIALMCAEKDPLTCHRAILVCRHLREFNLTISHIGPDGRLESHECLEHRLLKSLRVNGEDLISSQQEAVEHAYDLQGERIAYTRNPEERE